VIITTGRVVIPIAPAKSVGNGIIPNVSVVAIQVERIREGVNEGFVLMFVAISTISSQVQGSWWPWYFFPDWL